MVRCFHFFKYFFRSAITCFKEVLRYFSHQVKPHSMSAKRLENEKCFLCRVDKVDKNWHEWCFSLFFKESFERNSRNTRGISCWHWMWFCADQNFLSNHHYVKSVQMRSYFWSVVSSRVGTPLFWENPPFLGTPLFLKI